MECRGRLAAHLRPTGIGLPIVMLVSHRLIETPTGLEHYPACKSTCHMPITV